MLANVIKNKLKEIMGTDISFSPEDLVCYSFDATNRLFKPDAVAFVRTREDVSRILKLANEEGFAVVPRGAGSGFSGGSLAVKGGVILSLEKMHRIVEIDSLDLTAVVEPGVITGHLHDAVEKQGLFYPPDPSSLKFSTIGGNIAECAGGPRALKYGVTKDYVLGLEVVLPTGEIINTGTRTMKGVVGYDLTRLIVGSEGTLGVMTRATLSLLPFPEAQKTILASFKNIRDASITVSNIITRGVLPSTLELMDEESIKCVEGYRGLGIYGAGAMLLIEVDGKKECVEAEAEITRDTCFKSGAFNVTVARDKEESKKLWEARRAISPSLAKIKPHRLNEDVVVPRSNISELIEGVKNIGKVRGIAIPCFGHAGDGNIHVNVMIDRNDHEDLERGKAAVEDIFNLTLSLNGTISGEHGVGMTKVPYLDMELKPDVLSLMKRIKDVFDPKGILNPGKIFKT
ncbi:MAG: FAD-binding protein [Deltaproteobacteria bacterium]|nr:FAD-binding protein [Deltaproteobacteria bacterium]